MTLETSAVLHQIPRFFRLLDRPRCYVWISSFEVRGWNSKSSLFKEMPHHCRIRDFKLKGTQKMEYVISPKVIPLSNSSFNSTVPISGTAQKARREIGGPLTWLRRIVLSFSGAALFYNFDLFLSIIAFLYWAWSPIFSTAKENVYLHLKYPYAGKF